MLRKKRLCGFLRNGKGLEVPKNLEVGFGGASAFEVSWAVIFEFMEVSICAFIDVQTFEADCALMVVAAPWFCPNIFRNSCLSRIAWDIWYDTLGLQI